MWVKSNTDMIGWCHSYIYIFPLISDLFLIIFLSPFYTFPTGFYRKIIKSPWKTSKYTLRVKIKTSFTLVLNVVDFTVLVSDFIVFFWSFHYFWKAVRIRPQPLSTFRPFFFQKETMTNLFISRRLLVPKSEMEIVS